jgi:hypothetical protein
MMSEGFTFVVPVRNDAHRLRTALASINRAVGKAGAEAEVIVIDNGSVDDSAAVALAGGATVLNGSGMPVSAMRNLGADRARFAVLAFVDADHELAVGWVTAAQELLADPRVIACGAPYTCPAPGTWVQSAYDLLRPKPAGLQDVEWLGSGNLVVRRAAFLGVEGFDESLRTCEDVDLCRRLRGTGSRLVAHPDMRSTHYGDPRTLRAVFVGELWRGRDNIRVTLREPSARSLASLGVSLALALCVLVGLVGIWFAPYAAAAAGLCAVMLFVLRAVRMARAVASDSRQSFWRLVLVAGAYELGRATALFARISHRRPHAAKSVQAHV